METYTTIAGISGIIVLVSFVAGITFYDDIKKKTKGLSQRRKMHLSQRLRRSKARASRTGLIRNPGSKFLVDEKLDRSFKHKEFID